LNTSTDSDGIDVKSTNHTNCPLEIEGDIDVETEIRNRDSILVISKDQSFLTHGIHKFPAKFFPELPRYLIRKYSLVGSTVLDPMCGSGTVVLEALLNNRAAIGVDIDPIARLITKVKTTPLDPKRLRSAESKLIQQMQTLEASKDYVPHVPEFHYRDQWFRPSVLRELAIIRDSIEALFSHPSGEHCDDFRDFFRAIMSSIIRDMSNADSHCTRTVLRKKVVKSISPGETLLRFADVLSQQCDNMIRFSEECVKLEFNDVRLLEANAMDMNLHSDTIDLAITSPPYINAVDYPRTHQLEMYWLGFLDNSPLSKIKRKYIGTETVYKREYDALQSTGLTALDSVLEKIYELDRRRSYIVFKFFDDMKKQLSETMRVLKPDGRYCLVIGNNVVRGHSINSHDFLAKIATEHVGFILEKMFFSHVIRHFIKIPRQERIAGEWVLVLRK
jgi:DNA modification methylase